LLQLLLLLLTLLFLTRQTWCCCKKCCHFWKQNWGYFIYGFEFVTRLKMMNFHVQPTDCCPKWVCQTLSLIYKKNCSCPE
jgi:hypothetical protein